MRDVDLLTNGFEEEESGIVDDARLNLPLRLESTGNKSRNISHYSCKEILYHFTHTICTFLIVIEYEE